MMFNTKMSGVPPPAERFNINMNEFFKLLKSLLLKAEKHGFHVITMDLFDIGHNIAVNADIETVIKLFTERSYPHWDQIISKNDNYFSTHLAAILSDVPGLERGGQIFLVKDSNDKLVIDNDDRDIIWSYLGALIKTSIRFCQEKNLRWYDIPSEMKRWNLK